MSLRLKSSNELDHRLSVLLVHERTSSADEFLYHKTTRRELYDKALKRARVLGCVDALFVNLNDEVTEGAIHNVFVELDGSLVTPPLACGVLPGLFRADWLRRGLALELRLTVRDLQRAQSLTLTNAIRGARQLSEVLIEDEAGCVTTLWSEESAKLAEIIE